MWLMRSDALKNKTPKQARLAIRPLFLASPGELATSAVRCLCAPPGHHSLHPHHFMPRTKLELRPDQLIHIPVQGTGTQCGVGGLVEHAVTLPRCRAVVRTTHPFHLDFLLPLQCEPSTSTWRMCLSLPGDGMERPLFPILRDTIHLVCG